MNIGILKSLYSDFLKIYDEDKMNRIWTSHSMRFKEFWKNRVIKGRSENLKDEEIDEIIKILDRNGKGNTKESEAVARAMIAQGAWRRMFVELCANKELSNTITEIFEAKDDEYQSKSIDKLYELNKGKKNNLNGQSGNAINALLVAYDPFKNISIISLKDRLMLINYLQFSLSFNFEKASPGIRFIKTNEIIFNGFHALGFTYNARTLSRFFYYPSMKILWKGEHVIKRQDRNVEVTIPSKTETDEIEVDENEDPRESIRMQALLADIGSRMNMKIWIPKADRNRVLRHWHPDEGILLDTLPLNYDDTTLKTIELIDVLWLKGRSIIRAFEVEHTTSVYSGILRMADLLALQPNMAIKLHIVAPSSKRAKVFQEIRRPVFSLLERGPLADICTYLSYDNIHELSSEKHLKHLSNTVLDDYEESVND